MIESDPSFSPVDVSLSEFDDKDSDIFQERTTTERELSTRQAESPSDRAESSLSHVTVKNTMMLLRDAYENDAGALTSEPVFKKTQNAKSRDKMRQNKHRIWYEIPESTDEEGDTKREKSRKKTLEKRRTELRARSRRKRTSAGPARDGKTDTKESRAKSGSRTRNKKPTRKRMRAQATSILLVERRVETYEKCNSSGESVRPLESSLSLRIVEERYDALEDDFSDSRSSVDPGSGSSGESGHVRRKRTPDLVSEEEVKPKKRRKGKAQNDAKSKEDKKSVFKDYEKGDTKAKEEQKRTDVDKQEEKVTKEVSTIFVVCVDINCLQIVALIITFVELCSPQYTKDELSEYLMN